MSADPTTAGRDQEPLRVVSGDATPEEVVALVTALAAAASSRGGAGTPDGPPSRWADRAALLGAPPVPGPGAWTAAAWRR